MTLSEDVTPTGVEAHLVGRPVGILIDSPENLALFESLVGGITTEVVPLVGEDPDPGPKRSMAVWAITIGTAAMIESSLWPEQQGPGDLGRANVLTAKYEALLAQLRSSFAPTEGAALANGPRGTFPDPCDYPDPARSYRGFGYVVDYE